MAATNSPTEEEVVMRYQQLRQECLAMDSRISELENELHEHQLVADTLKPLNGDRRCHRLVGGALIERTVADILPELVENIKGIEEALAQLNKMLTEKQAAMDEYARKHGVTVAQRQGQTPAGGGGANNDEGEKKPMGADSRGVLV
ncbi:prefoldin subunit 2, putative [Trypanosoma brucei brucei TREU927]|uniref:Prefoldin subunit 2, putative n=1 Tax=Trypanosoma brucei brucei (strain 927/4 GUTat10.1) TaxID=185431 RepID=Q382R3_TRYB2|nr:prefoldin subunit 2, putative [Trypanosoma brucei brucei TREU927]EAN80218.1 prefoldin subunit 2, putative [Trypanosoma brucei brucei TREU927]